MRESATADAPPYMSGPTTHVERGHQRAVSFVTAAAAANAVVAWPEGKDCRSPFPKPFPTWKSCGLSPLETYGRERPPVPLITYVRASASSTDSVPCQP